MRVLRNARSSCLRRQVRRRLLRRFNLVVVYTILVARRRLWRIQTSL